MIAVLPLQSGAIALLCAIALSGIGFGLFQSPNNRTMMGAAPANRSGAAAGMLATSRLVGQTLGAVTVAAVFRVSGTTSVVAFVIAAALALVASGVSVGRLRTS